MPISNVFRLSVFFISTQSTYPVWRLYTPLYCLIIIMYFVSLVCETLLLILLIFGITLPQPSHKHQNPPDLHSTDLHSNQVCVRDENWFPIIIQFMSITTSSFTAFFVAKNKCHINVWNPPRQFIEQRAATESLNVNDFTVQLGESWITFFQAWTVNLARDTTSSSADSTVGPHCFLIGLARSAEVSTQNPISAAQWCSDGSAWLIVYTTVTLLVCSLCCIWLIVYNIIFITTHVIIKIYIVSVCDHTNETKWRKGWGQDLKSLMVPMAPYAVMSS